MWDDVSQIDDLILKLDPNTKVMESNKLKMKEEQNALQNIQKYFKKVLLLVAMKVFGFFLFKNDP